MVRIAGFSDADVKDIAGAAEAARQERPVRVVRSAAWSLASRLLPLSRLLPGLPITTMIGAQELRGVESREWRSSSAASAAGSTGAYRLTSFTRTYIYRRPSDLGEMQALLGDARLVKFAAALDVGIGMVGYDADAEVLYVPWERTFPACTQGLRCWRRATRRRRTPPNGSWSIATCHLASLRTSPRC